MASKKPIFDRDRAFKSIVGIEDNTAEEKKPQAEKSKPEDTKKTSAPQAQALETKAKAEKPIKKEATPASPKEIKESKERKEAKEDKQAKIFLPPAPPKRGRKILNREKRARYSFTILPSIYKHAQDKALKKGESLSEVISNFLKEYAK